ncbi:tubulin-specific chaperone A-like isoform X1 [Acomys russatus]|uniref:tubulin-specific chaperone A-like isoform X1 n=1 Tax=Acomys russatus TaxID=60746 RepID=UPI0021E29E40|nr:tubulin-specific chaperone A-like isoform X1 [Acomys russatus]
MADPHMRQIKIKTGMVERLVKEKVIGEKKRLGKVKPEDGENNAFKKQAEMLQASRVMSPDCQQQLEAAHTERQQILESNKGLEEAKEHEETHVALDSVTLEA